LRPALASRRIYQSIIGPEFKGKAPRLHRWWKKAKLIFTGPEIMGKKISIIGLGAIGVFCNAATIGHGSHWV